MSQNWVEDIEKMHEHYGVKAKLATLSPELLREFLKFRVSFLAEELAELQEAITWHDSEETVDALIDLCVVAIGTLDLFGVDSHSAWNEVLAANMNKEVGVKASRPNAFGLPDLIKPTMETHGRDWLAPSHAGNHGLLKGL
jgi:predicted HAD superfamily Cof-like phosphohydrolase